MAIVRKDTQGMFVKNIASAIYSILCIALTSCDVNIAPHPACKVGHSVTHSGTRDGQFQMWHCDKYYNCTDWRNLQPKDADQCIQYNKYLEQDY